MKTTKILLGSLTCFTLASNAYAANKTQVTDMLGAGNSALDFSVSVAFLKMAGSGSVKLDGESEAASVSFTYIYGVNDKLDIGLTLPISQRQWVEVKAIGTNTVSSRTDYEGRGDLTISAQHLLPSDNNDVTKKVLRGYVSPPTAASDDAIPDVFTNGFPSQAGKIGDSGKGYTSASFGGVISIPSESGDIYFSTDFTSHGGNGTGLTFSLGMESMLGDTLKITPFAALIKNSGDSTGNGNDYTIGLNLIQDVSQSLSVNVGAAYYGSGDISIGSSQDIEVSGYAFNVSTRLFF